MDYINRAHTSQIGRLVKKADVRDHLAHPETLTESLRDRYEKAIKYLTGYRYEKAIKHLTGSNL